MRKACPGVVVPGEETAAGRAGSNPGLKCCCKTGRCARCTKSLEFSLYSDDTLFKDQRLSFGKDGPGYW